MAKNKLPRALIKEPGFLVNGIKLELRTLTRNLLSPQRYSVSENIKSP
jgi:hypothetical protein